MEMQHLILGVASIYECNVVEPLDTSLVTPPKSLIVDPTKLQLKKLRPYLKYAFWGMVTLSQSVVELLQVEVEKTLKDLRS